MLAIASHVLLGHQLVNKLSWGVGKGELPPSRELARRLLGHLIVIIIIIMLQ